MPNAADIKWFKTTYGAAIQQGLAGTIFDLDMLTAIACQETGSLWGVMRHKNLTAEQIAALCCGDTLDADRGRRAFPRTKADLVAVPRGQEMFDIGRAALLAMAERVPGYEFARNRPNKFCHGYGLFQYDLQFFLNNPSYFLERRYERIENALARALEELKRGLRIMKLNNRSSITDMEFCHVAICYNTGGFRAERGLRQGHFDGTKFYGENIRDFLALARTTAATGATPVMHPPADGETALANGGTLTANGPKFKVQTQGSSLFLRSQPRISNPRTANVLADLPQGHIVTSLTGDLVNGFVEVETMLGGKLFHGFASAQFLKRINTVPASVATPAIPAAHLKQSSGAVTKRAAFATAFSLNEADMPSRNSTNPADLRSSLDHIIGFLDVEKASHKRYLPRDGLTFCNIYAHDYCSLARVYLPRVWWNGPALIKMASGATIQPLLGSTVDEMRANSLFRWLRDFGEQYGWRRAMTLNELQDHANLGGVAIIVARRKMDGKSGHIVAIVPETASNTALRNAAGRVTIPLQSQAGVVNFRRGRSTTSWWQDEKFAEFAFWIHA